MLVLNPKAAGTGLNSTSANHVIHYSPVWNPALEAQATARVDRRGQERKVTVHYFYYSRTVEEMIEDRLSLKRDLIGAAVVGNDGRDFDNKLLAEALAISPGVVA